MTKLPKAPTLSAVETAVLALQERETELAEIKANIESSEAALPALALDPDDTAFESASLNISRLQRSELRAAKRLEVAHATLKEAEAAAEQDRRRALYQAGKKAVEDAEALVTSEYKTHAAALAGTLTRLKELGDIVARANSSLPQGLGYLDRLDLDGFRHEADTPAGTTTETEYYHVDENGRECQPLYSWDPTAGKNVLRSQIKSREKTVPTRAWPGQKVSPLTYAVKLPAAVHGEEAFWPLTKPPAKYYEPTITVYETPQKPPQPALHGAVQPDGSRLFRLPPCVMTAD